MAVTLRNISVDRLNSDQGRVYSVDLRADEVGRNKIYDADGVPTVATDNVTVGNLIFGSEQNLNIGLRTTAQVGEGGLQ